MNQVDEKAACGCGVGARRVEPHTRLPQAGEVPMVETPLGVSCLYPPSPVLVPLHSFTDERGTFLEAFSLNRFHMTVVTCNVSVNRGPVLRGLHMQHGDRPMGKLVVCLTGRVLDVVVNAQQGSPRLGEVQAFPLIAACERGDMSDPATRQRSAAMGLWVPPGYLHGFVNCCDVSTLMYMADDEWSPADEIVVDALDTDLNIKWDVASSSSTTFVRSEKDRTGISWADYRKKLES